jgi:hypothetical protein
MCNVQAAKVNHAESLVEEQGRISWRDGLGKNKVSTRRLT